MEKTWLLIADASKARIFALHKARVFKDPRADNLELVTEFSHEENRKKESELVSDKEGEFGTSTFTEATSFKTHAAEQFASQLAKQLDTGRKEKKFKDIIIAAPPAFMGLLNKHMPDEVQKLICQTIEKDYTHHDERKLMENLLMHL